MPLRGSAARWERGRPHRPPPARLALGPRRHVRAALRPRSPRGALYLVWAAQSFLIQRGFMYVHMAEVLFMFGLWAAIAGGLPAAVILWIAATSTLWVLGDQSWKVRYRMYQIARHDSRPASDPDYEHFSCAIRSRTCSACASGPVLAHRSDRARAASPLGSIEAPDRSRGRVLVGGTR